MADTAEFGREAENEKVEECFVGVTDGILPDWPPSLNLSQEAGQTSQGFRPEAVVSICALESLYPTNEGRNGHGRPVYR